MVNIAKEKRAISTRLKENKVEASHQMKLEQYWLNGLTVRALNCHRRVRGLHPPILKTAMELYFFNTSCQLDQNGKHDKAIHNTENI